MPSILHGLPPQQFQTLMRTRQRHPVLTAQPTTSGMNGEHRGLSNIKVGDDVIPQRVTHHTEAVVIPSDPSGQPDHIHAFRHAHLTTAAGQKLCSGLLYPHGPHRPEGPMVTMTHTTTNAAPAWINNFIVAFDLTALQLPCAST